MRQFIAILLLGLLAACSSPNPELYTLAAMPGPISGLAVHSVEVRRVGIAGYLDRPDIVRSAAGFRLTLAQNQRWGEPLGGMLERVFAEDLVERLPGVAVFGESGAISTQPDLVLEVDVQRFDADADGALVLLAQVAVRRGDASRPAEARVLRLTARPASTSTHDQVAAMSGTLAEFADRVVRMLEEAARAPAVK